MSRNFENLKAHIILLSEADNFCDAKDEWELVDVAYDDDWDNCPCGKDIKELCYIKNQINDNRTYVGNICIKNFIGIETGNLFAGLKRIAVDETANANEDLIKHAFEFGYIFENEFKFLMDTRHSRKLSSKQLAWKQKINRRIIKKIVVRR